jgi:acetyl esterase/lipase
VSVYAAPGRAKKLKGLPPTYIDVGGHDLFCREALALASRLERADVDVELHVYPGVPHIFDLMAPDIAVTRLAFASRCRALAALKTEGADPA